MLADHIFIQIYSRMHQGRPQDFFQGIIGGGKGSVVGGHHGECGARGSRGRAPGQGVRGAKPPEA